MKVGDALLVESEVPTHNNVVLSLRLFQLFVIVCLEFHQRTKDILVLISIIVPTTNEQNKKLKST